jgi:hypothetical protein
MEGAGKLVEDDELREAMERRAWHAGDARRDHRGPDPRGVRASRGPRAGADAEGVLAHVRAAHAAHRRARSPELTGEWEHKLKLIEAASSRAKSS